MSIHHRLEPNRGAPGACLALGAALTSLGCAVDYFGFDQAFPKTPEDCLLNTVRFPWWLAAFLIRHGRQFDLIDCHTGDAWVWATLGRLPVGRRSVLTTRSQGLEHVVDQHLREGGAMLNWRYPIYHGGLRLWEVARSLKLSDHCVFTNAEDRDYARDRFRLSDGRLSVIPNGIGADFFKHHDVPLVDQGPIRLAFVGSWIPRKGIGMLVETLCALAETNLDFEVSLLGTIAQSSVVLANFPHSLRSRITVDSLYRNADLPRKLVGHHVLLCPSLAEGFSIALIEAMACGVVPIATPVGGVPAVIVPDSNGFIVPAGDAAAMVRAVRWLATERTVLARMRQRARETAQLYGWNEIARRNLELYEGLLRRKSSADVNSISRGMIQADVSRSGSALRSPEP